MINRGMLILCFLTLSTAIWSFPPSQVVPFFPLSRLSSFPAPSPVPESYSASYFFPIGTLKDGNFVVICLFRVASNEPTFISTNQLHIAFCSCSTVLIGKPLGVDGFNFSAKVIAGWRFIGQWPGGSLRRSGRLIVKRFVLKCRRWLVFIVLS